MDESSLSFSDQINHQSLGVDNGSSPLASFNFPGAAHQVPNSTLKLHLSVSDEKDPASLQEYTYGKAEYCTSSSRFLFGLIFNLFCSTGARCRKPLFQHDLPRSLFLSLGQFFKMALSSALKATIALLIIVVVVAVVVVVVIVVVGICRPASTVSGHMTNPLAVIAPSVGLACVLPLILLVLIVLGKIIILSFPFLPDLSGICAAHVMAMSLLQLVVVLNMAFHHCKSILAECNSSRVNLT
ncbi:hypothetical protein Tco_0690951 [Tanacetum coccineum]